MELVAVVRRTTPDLVHALDRAHPPRAICGALVDRALRTAEDGFAPFTLSQPAACPACLAAASTAASVPA